MIYRTVAALIVFFWILMTTLLIRNEVNPEDSRVREVPLTHVLKLLYLHEQASDLRIYAGGTAIGHLRVHPHRHRREGEGRGRVPRDRLPPVVPPDLHRHGSRQARGALPVRTA